MSEEPELKQPEVEESAADNPTAPPPHPRVRRWRRWSALAALVLVMLCGAWALRYYRSPEMRERVRLYTIQNLELATGGRVELGSVRWTLYPLAIDLEGLVVHGREGGNEAPLLAVKKIHARLRLLPLLRNRVALHELIAQSPHAHFEVYADGSTNLPEPRGPRRRQHDGLDELFNLAITRAELHDGELLWREQRIQLRGSVEDVALHLGYRPALRDYEGELRVGSVRLHMAQMEETGYGAEATFRLFRDRLEVSRLRVREGRSWLELEGVLNGLHTPVAQFTYRSTIDLPEIARLLRYDPLRAGAAQLTGHGLWRADGNQWQLSGKAQGVGVTWADNVVRLEKISGGFLYTLANGHLSINSLFATALGGTVHGGMEADGHGGRLQLSVEGASLGHALHAFHNEQLPLDLLRLSGEVSGPLDVHWVGSPLDAVMDGDLRIRPIARDGQLGVGGVVRASVIFRAQSVQVEQAELASPLTHLTAHGRMALDSDLKLDVATSDLHELEPMVTSWRGSRARALPIEFGGRAQFHGALTGDLGHPAVNGHLELRDFTTVLRVAAHDAQAAREVRTRWDLLEGDVDYSAIRENLRNAVLLRGGARIALDMSVALVNGNYDAHQPFSAHVRASSADAGDLQMLAGTAYPVSGEVSGDVHVEGTSSQMSGSGHVAIRRGSAWGQSVGEAVADISFTENQAQLRNIVVRADLMQLTGDARLNVESRDFGFHLKGTEVRLENLRAVRERNLPVSGQAWFEATGSGSTMAPVINGRLRLMNLAVKGHRVGELNVDAVTRGAEMTVTARSNFRGAELKADAQVQMRGEMPMQMSADVESHDLNPLLEALLPLRNGSSSELAMHLSASGAARRPRELTAQVEVSRWQTNYGGITVANDGPIRLKMAHQVISVEQFRLAGEQGTRFLQMHGDVQLAGNREIDLRADGSVNLKMFETVEPSLSASGVADLDLQVGGTLERPLARGRLNVHNASFADIDFPNGLSDINGSMAFNEDRLQVQELTARTGGGLMHCGGFVTFSASQGLGFNLSASGREIRLRYPEGLSSTADATLSLTGTLRNSLLSGEVTITRFGLNPQFDFASYLAKGLHGAPVQKIDTPLNNVHLDVHVDSSPELQVQTTLARLSGNVDLRLRGTAARPVVLGRVNLLEGMIFFNGTKYRLERGDITLTNPVRIDPALDVELSARVRDYDITLGFHGPLNHLTPSYRSDPPLASSDIISLLALGRTAEESANPAMLGSSQYQPTVSESASTAILGQALSATVGSRVQRLFGVSRLKIDPNVGGALNAGLARVTVEQQVSNKLTLTYITNLNQSAQQIIQFEYNVSKDVSIVGVRDQTGVVSLDVLFRKRHK